MKTKLNLACGKHYQPSTYDTTWVNIDNRSMYEGKMDLDLEADVFTLGWKNNSVDEILLSHFMMYVPLPQAPELLARWHGWLKKGGQLVIETGDVKKIAQNILDSHDPDVINGQDCLKELFGWDTTTGHKWAYCEDTLVSLLIDGAGFSHVEVKDGQIHNRPQRDSMFIATK